MRNKAGVGELDLLHLSQAVLIVAIKVSTPILLAVAGVGLVVSLIQALTQVQEQSLSFVPKLLAGVGVMLGLGSWMLTVMLDLATSLLNQIGTATI